MPYYLLLPFLATILIVFGFMFNKRAMAAGANAWTVTLVANLWAAVIFSLLLFRDDAWQPWQFYWQPLVIGVLYILGQVFTFLALERGDVSVATPVFSVKVLSVAILATVLAGESLSGRIWFAACLATVGIALVQSSEPARRHTRIVFSIVFALLAAATFSLFDVVIQLWTQEGRWGAGRLLPLSIGSAALMSVVFVPYLKLETLRDRRVLVPLGLGTMMIGMQAFCIVFTMAFTATWRVSTLCTRCAACGVCCWRGSSHVYSRAPKRRYHRA